MVLRLLLFAWLSLLSPNSYAAGDTLLIVERDTSLGLEQTSLLAKNGRATLVTNSNFLQSDQAKRHLLGMFEASAPDLALRIEDLAKRPVPKPNKRVHVSPHNLRVRINNRAIPLGSALYDEAVALAGEASGLQSWIAKDGAVVDRGARPLVRKIRAGATLASEAPGDELPCSKVKSALSVCTVKGFGYVHQ